MIRWRGHTLVCDWMPGQTEFACCVHGEIDGKRVAFTGDNIFGSPADQAQHGHEAVVARNSCTVEEGYGHAMWSASASRGKPCDRGDYGRTGEWTAFRGTTWQVGHGTDNRRLELGDAGTRATACDARRRACGKLWWRGQVAPREQITPREHVDPRRGGWQWRQECLTGGCRIEAHHHDMTGPSSILPQDVAKSFGAVRTPEFFVLDRQRRIVYMSGFDDATKPAEVTKRHVEEPLESLLAGREVAVKETAPVGCLIRFDRKRSRR